jgi:Beta-galactosidase jelly roll domain/Beta-galactosidase, domain 3
MYHYWVPELSSSSDGPGFSSWTNTQNSIIVHGGYLIRTSYLQGSQLHVTADFNVTTALEVIGAPEAANSLYVNGQEVSHEVDPNGIWLAIINYQAPELNLPDLEKADWKYIDSLPEIQNYDDSAWPLANLTQTANNQNPLNTPTSLYGADYGFNTGFLIYRGRFTASGNETTLNLHTQGVSAFGTSIWLNTTSIGSWQGGAADADNAGSYALPHLDAAKPYILTVIVDQNGFEENGAVGSDSMKAPRGILDYSLDGHDAVDVAWKLTGNLGGENYADHARGPLNEGGMYAERQGWHQPSPPCGDWEDLSVTQGVAGMGVGFFTANFTLDIPSSYDVPLTFTFANTTVPTPTYHVQLYINGYQFGKYINSMGPQVDFPVPEGVLKYRGENWIAITLWSLEEGGAKVDGIKLTAGTLVMTAY